jgi:hypothetical protein
VLHLETILMLVGMNIQLVHQRPIGLPAVHPLMAVGPIFPMMNSAGEVIPGYILRN